MGRTRRAARQALVVASASAAAGAASAASAATRAVASRLRTAVVPVLDGRRCASRGASARFGVKPWQKSRVAVPKPVSDTGWRQGQNVPIVRLLRDVIGARRSGRARAALCGHGSARSESPGRMAILGGRSWRFRSEKHRSRGATSAAPSTASPRRASAFARTATSRRDRTRCARRARRTAVARSSRSAHSAPKAMARVAVDAETPPAVPVSGI